MKYYVVILDWAHDDERGVEILGVGDTYDEAKEIFANRIDEEKQFAEEHEYGIHVDMEREFEAGILGYWNEEHTVLYIKEV